MISMSLIKENNNNNEITKGYKLRITKWLKITDVEWINHPK